MSDNYILEGHTPVPVDDALVWARWFERADRTVAKTVLGDIRVSTVFLGLDHNWGRLLGADTPPLLFETMVFGSDHPDLDEYQRRYSTWDEAEEGHAAAVALVDQTLAAPQ